MLKLEKKTKVFENNTYDFSKDQLGENKFDLIFLDPPFLDENINELIEKIKKTNIADKNTLIIIHRNKKTKEKINNSLSILREKNYGISKIIFAKFLT